MADPVKQDPGPTTFAGALATPSALEARIGNVLKGIALPRMSVWLYVSIALLGAVWYFASHMLGVILFKAVIITICSFLGDKVARAVEASNRRPHELLAEAEALRVGIVKATPADIERAWQLEQLAHGIYYRRALIIGACVIAGALGS